MAIEDPFPQRIRSRPERYVGGSGRFGAYYLTDHLFQAMVWGEGSESFPELVIQVQADGTLEVERRFPGDEELWPALPGNMVPPPGRSLMSHCFHRCIRAIKKGKPPELAWVKGNPYLCLYLPVAVALSSRARVELSSRGRNLGQSYRKGQAVAAVEELEAAPTGLRLQALLDKEILDSDIPAYPFRIRMREFACLLPGLEIRLEYKRFPPVEYRSENGIADLLRFLIPQAERFHRDPFTFELETEGLRYRCAVLFIESEMERLKSYSLLDESLHGGTHERVLRQTVRETLAVLGLKKVPIRRQSWANIATSRSTYYGKYAVTVPQHPGLQGLGQARTLPGVAAVIHLSTPELKWETRLRNRVVAPELLHRVRPPLKEAFRAWALEHMEALEKWSSQWDRRSRRGKRKKKKAAASSPSRDQVGPVEQGGGR